VEKLAEPINIIMTWLGAIIVYLWLYRAASRYLNGLACYEFITIIIRFDGGLIGAIDN
jgi:hypothetical protein